MRKKQIEKTIPVKTIDVKKEKPEKKLHRHLLQAQRKGTTINTTMKTVEHSVDSTMFKYCDTVSDKLRDWVEYEGRESCVSTMLKRRCVCGRCANKTCIRIKIRAIFFMCNLTI